MADVWSSGASYEPYIGRWSRKLAPQFLEWAALPEKARALDVGCGTGAVSQALADGLAASVTGIDQSPAFVEYARRSVRPGPLTTVQFEVGDATRLTFESGAFDAAVSGLVLNFVPDPLAMALEMRRVLRPGGRAAVYVWDYAGRMDMIRLFWDAAVALHPEKAGPLDEGRRFPICAPGPLVALFKQAGFHDVTFGRIEQPTVFRDFDDYWGPFLLGQGPAPAYCMSLSEDERVKLRERVRSRLKPNADGSIAMTARAWAVRGDA